MQRSPSSFRVFHFVCDDLPYSFAVDHSPGLGGPEQDRYLIEQFHSLLETVLPGRRAAGDITGITSFDDTHPELPPEGVSREIARIDFRNGMAHHAEVEWGKAVAR